MIRKSGENQTIKKNSKLFLIKQTNITCMSKNVQKSKFFYDIFKLNNNTCTCTYVTTGKIRWNELLDIEDMQWKIIHELHFTTSTTTKLLLTF